MLVRLRDRADEVRAVRTVSSCNDLDEYR
jgi:hypothetical protein